MKLETRQRLEHGPWGQEEAVTSVSWVVSSTVVKKEVTDVKVYLLNEQKRMMILSFRDADEVRELASQLLAQLAP